MNTFFLANTPLFHGIKEDEIKEMLSCLNAREHSYRKDEVIFRAGSSVGEIGLILSGSVNIVVNFYWGSSHIFGHIGKGHVFAENYAAIPGKELICDIVSCEETEVLFLNMRNMLTTCQRGCAFHTRIIQNMLKISESIYPDDAYGVKILARKAALLSFGAGIRAWKHTFHDPV